ncbi:hypothetical protein [Agromyces lapidis]|uniref:SAF domain-containing protein n=1 Tax=Agromyces lapidis TaxID=279574 RepID=A0ABV5SRJ0_9MICO|nr:hypothetical protein [Agromyces lapidis]
MTARSRGERGAVRLDPRLLIGLVLVAGSTLGVWALVSGLDDTVEVYVARDTLTPGAPLELDALDVASVRLGASEQHYLLVDGAPESSLVVARTVRAGELVPVAAVDDADRTGLSTVVVPSRGALPSGLEAGALVDVWSAKATERSGFEAPKVLVGGAEIAALVEESGMMASEGTSVELLIPREKVAALLEALAAGDAVDLVATRSAGD